MPGLVKPAWPLWQPAKSPEGCRLYLPLTEGSGTTVRDASASRWHGGSGSGSPTWIATPYGPGLSFDGVDDAIRLGNSPDLLLTGATTVTALVRWRGAASFRRILSTRINGNQGYFLSLTDGVPRFGVGTGGSLVQAAATVALTALRWYVLTGTYDGANARLFVDGSLAVTAAATGLIDQTGASLWLGCEGNGSAAFGDFDLAAVVLQSGASPASAVASLAQDLLSGRFSAVRPSSNLALWAALAPTPVAPTGSPAAIMLSF